MQTEWNFGYNGSPQSVILKPGKYKFECWGSSEVSIILPGILMLKADILKVKLH